MKIKDDGKMCGYEGEEWVSDYDFVPGRRQLMRQTRASNIRKKHKKKDIFKIQW